MSGHYRNQINFTYSSLDQARETVDAINDFVSKAKFVIERTGINQNNHLTKEIESLQEEFEKALDDDLNVSDALAAFQEMIREINTAIDNKEADKKSLQKALEFVKFFNEVFDIIDFDRIEKGMEITGEEMELIKERDGFRMEKIFEEADEIRNILKSHGIYLEDTPYGTRWIKK